MATGGKRVLAWVSAVLVALVPLAFGYAGYGRRWAGDDGFINLRVVSHLLQGNGFVFNVGERCEAVTSAGWILFLWLLGALGIELDTAAWVGGLTLSVLGLAAAALGSARLSDRDEARPSLVLPFGISVYAAVPVAWDYATSALENGIGMAFLGGAYCAVAYAVRPTPHTGSLAYRIAVALFIGCAPLMRPDYALYVPALIALLLIDSASWRERGKLVLATGVVGVVFQVFRMGYFAALVPNTAIAKEAFESRWGQGGRYLDNTFETYALWGPVALLLLVLLVCAGISLRRKEWRLALLPVAFAASGVLHMLYVVRVGGDFMHGRMLLPGLFAICTSVGTLRLRRGWLPTSLPLVATAAVSAWAVYCADTLRPPDFVHQILDERNWYTATSKQPHPTHLRHYDQHMFYVGPSWARGKIAEGCKSGLAALEAGSSEQCAHQVWPDYAGGLLSDLPEGVQLAMSPRFVDPSVVAVYEMRPIGIIGRLMGLRIDVVDLYGLADPLASRMELAERGRPGHEKNFPTHWFAAKYGAPEATHDPRVALARKALDCGALKELHAATHEPLSFGRFFRNLGLSFSLHHVRVPADPALAVELFCKG